MPKYKTIDLVGDSAVKVPAGVRQAAVCCSVTSRPAVVASLINEYAPTGRVIVFTQTKQEASDLAHSEALPGLWQKFVKDKRERERERERERYREIHEK
jgi:superfamily II DNA/RNA helicase